ncbi:MAG: flippase [Nitrospirae bacterium]|nr:flippase [Nitrospirota bacterium]
MRNPSDRLLPIIKNTSSTILIRGLFGVARIILLLLIARKFGPADFGRLSLALSVVELFRFAADLGIDTVLIRQFSINRLSAEKLLGNSLILKLTTATAGYLATVFLFRIFYGRIDALNLLFILSATIYTTLFINAFVSYYQAKLRMAEIVGSNAMCAAAYVFLTLLGLSMNWSLATLCVIMPLSELANLYLIYKVYKRSSSLTFSFDPQIIRHLLREGFPVAFSNIMVVTYMRLDQLMLGWFKGETAIGEYAAAFRVTEPFMLVFTSLSISLYASLSGAWDGPRARIRTTALRVIGPTVVITFCIASLLSLFSQDIMGLISKAYTHSSEALRLLGWAMMFKAVNAQLTAIINSKGLYRIITVTALLNLAINVSLNLLLIPRYGIIGAAWSVVLTEGVNTILQSGYIIIGLKNVRAVEMQQ